MGGTSRYLAKHFGKKTTVSGITLSPEQVKRASELATEQGVNNANFQVMDALNMQYPDDTFDVVWACESGEHMPDKKKYVQEMMRVLKPGGKLVFACWCKRDDSKNPLSEHEKAEIDIMCKEWEHPYFASVSQFKFYMKATGQVKKIHDENWSKYTAPSWRHSIWVGVFDPLPVVLRPYLWKKTIRDAYVLNVFHNAFGST